MKHNQNPTNPARRGFMRASSLLLTGSAAYAVTPNFAWAQNSEMLEDLATVSYALYPHKNLPFDFYRASAQGLLDKANGDKNLKKTLQGGIETLNAVYSTPFRDLAAEEQTLALQRVATTPFFQSVRGHTVVGLYNIPQVWAYFGYEGPSFPKGGYLNRGLDDIHWLDNA